MVATVFKLAVGVVVVAAVLLIGLAACDGQLPWTAWQWNQKLTVEVTTPNGMKSGAAVSSVSWSKKSSSITFNYAASYRGEATVVEVAPGKYLFALIGEPTKFLAGTVFGGERPYGNIPAIRETRDVPRDRYPLLVTFSDISNPKTVKKVDPGNLAASFGPGVRLKSITLEITDEAADFDAVPLLLPWTKWSREQMLAAGFGGWGSRIQGGPVTELNLWRNL